MYETITAALTGLVDFSDEELFRFMQRLRPRRLKKNEYILVAGETCNAMTIVAEGALRYFAATGTGEQNFWFAFEGDWLGDYGSFLMRTPSEHYMQALEDSEVFCLSYEDMQQLYSMGANYERFGRLIAERLFLAASRSWSSLASLSAEQRYLNLLREDPRIVRRVSQQHIATYLGIQPQSLSRIRSRLARQQD
jgi:CRP-like cAMP-binding protein